MQEEPTAFADGVEIREASWNNKDAIDGIMGESILARRGTGEIKSKEGKTM
jgi:hypothetical protein